MRTRIPAGRRGAVIRAVGGLVGALLLQGACGAAPAGPSGSSGRQDAGREAPATPAEEAGAEEAAAPVDHALLVGCTEYPRRPARDGLRGCENDVRLIAERFTTVLGVAPERTLVLAGWPEDEASRPTKANILGALRGLAERARPGDRVLIYLAGHGSQQPDGRDGDELDGYDEVFLPADAGGVVRRRGRETIDGAITDDELFEAIRALLAAELRVCLFSDSCHSATLARGGEVRARGIEPEAFGFEPPAAGTRGGRAARRPGDDLSSPRFVALYAVQADEQAKEAPLPASESEQPVVHGVFSWSLARALSRTGGDATFDDLYRLVIAGYRELGHGEITPFLQGERQTPLRAGAGEVASSLFARRAGERIEVDGGLLHGLYPGTRLRVLTPDKQQTLGELRVVAATSLSAACAPLGAEDLPAITADARLPVEVLERAAGGRALSVYAGGAEPAWLPALRAEDPGGARVQLVETSAEADWLLEPDGDAWRLQRAAGGARYRVGVGQLPRTLLGLHRVANLLRLPARAGGELPAELEVELLRDGGAPVLEGDTLRPGTGLTLRARNAGAAPVDLWVFWIDADRGITRCFPGDDEPAPLLEPAAKERRRATPIEAREVGLYALDASQGAEHFLFLAVPPATSDLGFLETAGLELDRRGETAGEAAELLDELAFGPRERAAYTAGLGAGFHAALRSVTATWEPVRAPARVDGRTLELGAPPATPPAGRPDPWRLGERVVVHEREGVRVVADRAEAPRLLLFQFGAPQIVPDDELAAELRERRFGAQLALAFEPETGARVAFYDRDLGGGPGEDAPRFERIRVELDGDLLADREHRFEDGAWHLRDEPALPWLRLAELDFALIAPRDPYAAEEAAFAAVRALCCPDD